MTVVWPVFSVSLSISQLYKRVCRRTRSPRLLGSGASGVGDQLPAVPCAVGGGVARSRLGVSSALQRASCNLHGARWKSVVCHVDWKAALKYPR